MAQYSTLKDYEFELNWKHMALHWAGIESYRMVAKVKLYYTWTQF